MSIHHCEINSERIKGRISYYLYSTERLQNIAVTSLKHCNIAWWLRNVAESLLQDSNNVKMSAFCNIATKHSNIAM